MLHNKEIYRKDRTIYVSSREANPTPTHIEITSLMVMLVNTTVVNSVIMTNISVVAINVESKVGQNSLTYVIMNYL